MVLDWATERSMVTYSSVRLYGTVRSYVQYGNFGLLGYGRTRTGTAKNNSRTLYYFVASLKLRLARHSNLIL